MSELDQWQQQQIMRLLIVSVVCFIASIGFLLWAYFGWGIYE